MDIEEELSQLIVRLGLDRKAIASRLRFLQWDRSDAEQLNATAERMESAHALFLQRFYDHLGECQDIAALVADESTLLRLKHSQRCYYQRLWHGPYDRDYVLDRLRIGWIHQRVGVDTHWYLGAYRMYLDVMLQALVGDHPQAATCASLLKAVFFDMALAIDTYNCAQSQALEESESRFARALRGANDGIWEWHVEQDRLYLSERWASMLGLTLDSLGQNSASWFSRVHPDDLPGLRRAIQAHLQGDTASLRHEYRIRNRADAYIWVLVRAVSEAVAPGQHRMAGSQSDIGRRRAAVEELRHAARHDPLTGLANRAQLAELLSQALERRQRSGARETALLFIDLDRFKLINDSLGHAAGDQVLVEVARRLNACLRPGDHLVRFGGDEFVALLDDMAALGDAEQIAQRMLDNLRQPMHLQQQTLVISASIGIAPLNDQPGLDPLQAADLALYGAKAAGKAQFVRYSAELQSAAQRQLHLESALGQALQRGEFELHYQPICQIADEHCRVIGVEALLRWKLGTELVSPMEFIPALEESGEIVAVGDWVLRQACRQVRHWQLAGQTTLRCSVNLSIRQLQRVDFAALVEEILRETGLAATDLILEITESQLMQDTAQILACLRELAALGVRLALDDFGTGFSSLGYLKRFPLHILKLDKSFISAIPEDPESCVISQAIIGLGRNLGLQVVAEGVETHAHLAFLREQGCETAQGYWFSRPRPAAELERLFGDDDCFEGLWCLLAEGELNSSSAIQARRKAPRSR